MKQKVISEIHFKAHEAKMILKHNKIDNKKPKLLDMYLDKVARVVGITRDKQD